MRSKVLGGFLCLFAAVCLEGQQGPSFGVFATPEAYVPAGGKAESYTFGLGGRIEGLLGVEAIPGVTPLFDGGYAFVPLDLAEDGFAASSNLSLLRAGIGAKATYSLGERFMLFARGHGSGFYGMLTGEETGSATGICAGGGGGLGVLLSSRLQLELSGGYVSYIGLYDGVTVSIGTTLRLSGPGNDAIPRKDFSPAGTGPASGYVRFSSVQLDRVFPVLYKYYDDHPIGFATVVNEGSRSVEDLEVRLALRQFMDAPKLSARIDSLAPGEEARIDIYALFTEEILSVTEGAKVAAELTADYAVAGRPGTDAEVITLETFNRNALQWDDDEKIAAFVTARDDEVQRFSRNIASITDDFGVDAVARELQLAMVFCTAMAEHRVSYVVDPSSAYFELSRDAAAVDSVQFPRQTLQFRAGDCDDLAATYAALLESAGVPTAFITVPGHIYTAFRLETSDAEARRAFARPDDLLVRRDGSVWIPVETTLVRDGFLAAWAEGAAQWRRYEPEGKASFFATQTAWSTYEPVAFDISEYEIEMPLRNQVASAFRAELDRFIERELSGREGRLLARLERRPGDRGLRNRLGVLYARYGRYEQAEEQFRLAAGRDFVPALVNLGNLSFLRGNHERARELYDRALNVHPDNEAALLGRARADYAAENYPAASEAHARLSRLSPGLAERFSYLGAGPSGGERASEGGRLSAVVVWDEEE